MTIIIDRIITPYEIARYNEINRVLSGNLEVWFLAKTEVDKKRRSFPKIEFKYRFLINFKIIKLLNKYKSKINRVVCCGWDSFSYLYALWFCKRNKKRYTFWSGSTSYEKSWLRTLFLPFIKFVVSQANDYIAYGRRAKDYLVFLGAEKEKIKIFLNSVDVDYFKNEGEKWRKKKTPLRRKYGIEKDDTVFLFIGQLIERKGVRELLSAFKKVFSTRKNITLVIVGEGGLKKDVLLFMAENPQLKIKYLGYIQYDKLPQIYSISDVLILPSKKEVWGLVVNEALACNVPVLVSKFAGCSVDLVNKNNGEIITEISEERIVEVMRRFLKKKYRISSFILEKMKNKQYIETTFTNFIG